MARHVQASRGAFFREGVKSIPQSGGPFVLFTGDGAIDLVEDRTPERLLIHEIRGLIGNPTDVGGGSVLRSTDHRFQLFGEGFVAGRTSEQARLAELSERRAAGLAATVAAFAASAAGDLDLHGRKVRQKLGHRGGVGKFESGLQRMLAAEMDLDAFGDIDLMHFGGLFTTIAFNIHDLLHDSGGGRPRPRSDRSSGQRGSGILSR